MGVEDSLSEVIGNLVEDLPEGTLSPDQVKSVADEIALDSEPGLLTNILDKFKHRISEGVEGQVLQELKERVGIDANQLLMPEDSASWSIGLALISVVFLGGGIVEAQIASAVDDDMNIPIDNVPAQMPVVFAYESSRRPLFILLAVEMTALFFSLQYTPLTVSLPAIALHQISRVLGLAVKGKAIGGRLVRIGMACILFGFLMTCLFGYHQTLDAHTWDKIMTALWSSIFQIWSTICGLIAIISIAIAYVSPVRPGTSTESSMSMFSQPQQDSVLMRIFKMVRINCLVYLLNIPVSWSTKRYAFSAVTGIMSGFLLIIIQQATLTLAVTTHISSLLGLRTFMLAFGCGIYALICISVVHYALATFESSKFLPSAMCWTISIGALNELVLQLVCFEENAITIIRLFFYLFGLTILCCGLICMGQADVRQQLEDLQFLASEVSRLGVVIEGTFLEAGASSHLHGDSVKIDNIENGHIELEVGSHITLLDGIDKATNLDLKTTNPDLFFDQLNLDGNDAISTAFSMDGDNNYVQSILSDIRMT
eukprot:GHVH01002878.1.p1 GENE.GHVH01002878.1~~GHVH01002878.1.p1  ORF type:complete len:541 (+),score=64.13 GHVH01002878.1:1264-2886(+)